MKQPLAEIIAAVRSVIDESRPVTSYAETKLVDEINYLRELESVVSAREKRLLDTLKERLHLEEITEEVTVTGKISKGLLVIPVKQSRLNSDLIKKEQGIEWYNAHCKEISFIQIRTLK